MAAEYASEHIAWKIWWNQEQALGEVSLIGVLNLMYSDSWGPQYNILLGGEIVAYNLFPKEVHYLFILNSLPKNNLLDNFDKLMLLSYIITYLISESLGYCWIVEECS